MSLPKKRDAIAPLSRPNTKWGSQFPQLHFKRFGFPSIPGILGTPTRNTARHTSSLINPALSSWANIGPLLGRWVMRHDAIAISFYKMFGFPTGVGALVVKKSFLARLKRPWFAGGTVDVVQVPGSIVTRATEPHEQFEVGYMICQFPFLI